MDFEETTINSKTIYTGKILNLRVDEVKLPDGKISSREIVEHSGAVAIVAVNKKDEVLMVKQYRKPVESVLLEIPAGKLEKGESKEACAQRELMEETGYFANDLKYIMDFYTTPGFSNELMHLFFAKNLVARKKEADFDENLILETIPIKQAISKIKTGEIKDGKTIVGLLLAYHFMEGDK